MNGNARSDHDDYYEIVSNLYFTMKWNLSLSFCFAFVYQKKFGFEFKNIYLQATRFLTSLFTQIEKLRESGRLLLFLETHKIFTYFKHF